MMWRLNKKSKPFHVKGNAEEDTMNTSQISALIHWNIVAQ